MWLIDSSRQSDENFFLFLFLFNFLISLLVVTCRWHMYIRRKDSDHELRTRKDEISNRWSISLLSFPIAHKLFVINWGNKRRTDIQLTIEHFPNNPIELISWPRNHGNETIITYLLFCFFDNQCARFSSFIRVVRINFERVSLFRHA